jgi:pimeloyl-ACP methyl ester carboxylesterase
MKCGGNFNLWRMLLAAALWAFTTCAAAQVDTRVVDIPTRPGVTQRFLYLTPSKPKAAVVLYAGGHGGLKISDSGEFGWGKGNFLVRSRSLFAEQGLAVAVVDAPSDREDLKAFRQTATHVDDARAVLAWLRAETRAPVWLVGTSNGTLSVAFIATQLSRADGGPDGVVLTATILVGREGRTRPVPDMPLERISIPTLLVHHKQDGCVACPFAATEKAMAKLIAIPRKELIAFDGGENRGDPCEAYAHHGFNGLEREVVSRIAEWILK